MRYLTADLPGTGGLMKAVAEDFVVEELPAYPPSGEGEHTFLFIEKRGLTTDEALRRVARALGADANAAGTAGQKDRHAVTRQWISLHRVDPTHALTVELDGVRVLDARPHPHKLRTGHLVGNRFTITVRGTTDGVQRAEAILLRLSERGLPNHFGPQRFGARGDNAVRGRALLDGSERSRSRSERRLLVSAYQSALFNRYLERRLEEDLIAVPIAGDVVKKRETGGLFYAAADDLANVAARLQAGEVAITGPMFGHKMMAPPEGSPSAAREAALLAEEHLQPASFAQLGKLAEGTRRPLLEPVIAPSVRKGDTPDVIVLAFQLPPGCYATTLLGEVMKPTPAAPGESNPV
jgi:tRNA pseudouridine13 synthase